MRTNLKSTILTKRSQTQKRSYARNQVSGYLWERVELIGKGFEENFLLMKMSVLIDKGVHYRNVCLCQN